jgi:hypothetical protein
MYVGASFFGRFTPVLLLDEIQLILVLLLKSNAWMEPCTLAAPHLHYTASK